MFMAPIIPRQFHTNEGFQWWISHTLFVLTNISFEDAVLGENNIITAKFGSNLTQVLSVRACTEISHIVLMQQKKP
jgi:hypothetical protein